MSVARCAVDGRDGMAGEVRIVKVRSDELRFVAARPGRRGSECFGSVSYGNAGCCMVMYGLAGKVRYGMVW